MDNLKVTYFETNKLIPDPGNVRQHDKRNIETIKQSIQRFGIRKPVVAHEDSSIVYAGNGVLLAALELEIESIPVAWIPAGTPVEVAKAYSIYDNRTTELSSFDPELLNSLVDELDDFDLDELLWTPVELEELLQDIETQNGQKDEDFDVDSANDDEVEPITKTGDIWLCGKHRVMAGDSTKVEDVERLMGGKKAVLLLTDPPYNLGINYADCFDDAKTRQEYSLFIDDFWELSVRFSEKQIITPGKQNLIMWAKKNWFDIACWYKKNAMSGCKISYLSLWEPILFWGDFDRNSRASDFFEYNVAQQPNVGNHPCPRILNLWVDLVTNYSKSKDYIYDPFLGSGTTLIACEKLNRICYGMEISCAYTDVVCRRYLSFTNQVPVREADGFEFPID